MNESYPTFNAVKERLDEIVEAVGGDELLLDDALDLYEEAVALGLHASDMLEADIQDQNASEEGVSNEVGPQDGDRLVSGANSQAATGVTEAQNTQTSAGTDEENPTVSAAESTPLASGWPSRR